MKIPKKISPCPIVEAVIGIRFEPNTDNDAIFGIIYNALKEKYPVVDKFPVLQIPEEIRNKDDQFLNQPHYRIKNNDYAVLISPRIISLSVIDEYVGWEKLLAESKELFGTIGTLNIIDRVNRLGLRYINVFDFDIFDKITLNIESKGFSLKSASNLLRTEFECGDFMSALQISNKASGKSQDKPFSGSIIDIDTYTTKNLDSFFLDCTSLLEKGHNEEKKVFFNLLNPEYVDELNPDY